MCLTAKPTVEWTLSTVQNEPAGVGVVAMGLMVSPCKWTVVRFVEETVAHEPDRGPVILRGVSALPLINAEPPKRADAARNRRAVLDAAARLFARDGAGCVTME